MIKLLLTIFLFTLLIGSVNALTTEKNPLCNNPQDMSICLGVQIWDTPLYDYCLRYDFNRDTKINLIDVVYLARMCY